MTTSVQNRKASERFALKGCLSRPEIILVSMLVLSVLLSLLLSVLKAQPIAWGGFAMGLAPTVGLLAAGLYIRQFKNQPRIAQLAIANSLFLGFMGITTLLIYLRFPIAELSFDKLLMQADAALGYSWPQFLEVLAAYPDAGRALSYVYHSSLPQLFIMVGYLALTGRSDALDRALMAGIFGLLFTTLIWWIVPSVGPSVFYDLPVGLEKKIDLVTNSTYAQILRTLSDQGLAVIAPSDIVGTIAFPSYHTIMALLVVWYLRGTALFIPALILNVAMVPAILSHGGHHLTDMIGGIVVFAVSAWLAALPMLRGTADQN